jgi:Ser/Thr protein kinase RdoA (MazF antagonist)
MNATMSDPFVVLTTPPPKFSISRAGQVLNSYFGIRGQLKPLVSERDQNFQVTTDAGERFVMKIANSAEDSEVTDFQNGALLHVAKADEGFPVPRLHEALNGEYSVAVAADDGRGHLVRVLSWLDGTPLRFVDKTHDVAHSLGDCLARLDVALQGYEHPASGYRLLWDINRAASLSGLLEHIEDQNLSDLCASRLERFERVVRPKLAGMRCQVIYNDLNPSNVLVSQESVTDVTGVIDFGDMVHSPLVVDPAVAAAYLCTYDEDPFIEVVKFLGAYTRTLALKAEEIDLLYDLILTRHVLTVLITNWRAAQHPQNRDYILRNEGKARRILQSSAKQRSGKVAARFRDVCMRSV